MTTTADRKYKVLVIDDESSNCELIEQILAPKVNILKALDGEEGVRMAKLEQPDLVLLDISMPKLDGLTACEVLRNGEATRHIPVIMLTAADDLEHRVQAFSIGADDFIAKPFKPSELSARVHSKLRRIGEQSAQPQLIQCGNLTLNLDKLEAAIETRVVKLSVLEFNLLKYLVMNKDKVMSRERILEAVWRDCVVSYRTVDAHIVSLRKRLEGFDHEISTVYGAGYILRR